MFLRVPCGSKTPLDHHQNFDN
uniref:Uncharacterized protein n=1 Tax=Arundo donax TaxID=35708 RepID=A0A0A9BRV7_ARUDO